MINFVIMTIPTEVQDNCIFPIENNSIAIGGLEISIWIAIIGTLFTALSFFFAAVTYWFDRYKKNKLKKQTKKNLQKELSILYRTVCIDILKYKKVKESNYRKDFLVSVYHYPVLKYLATNNKINEYFQDGEEYFVGLNIHQTLTQLDNPPKTGFSPPIIPRAIDWFFQNRLLDLREELLNLVRYGNATTYLDIRREMHSEVLQFVNSLNNDTQ